MSENKTIVDYSSYPGLCKIKAVEYITRTLRAGGRGYLVKESLGLELIRAIRVIHMGGLYLSHNIKGYHFEN